VKGAPLPASRPSAAPLGLARPFLARRPASPHPSLSRGIKTRPPSLLVHFSSVFLLTSTILLALAAVYAPHLSIIVDRRRGFASSIDTRDFVSSLAFDLLIDRPSLFSNIAHPRQSLRASSIIVLSLTHSHSLENRSLSLHSWLLLSLIKDDLCLRRAKGSWRSF